MRNDINIIIYASDASQGSWAAFDIAIHQAIKNQAEIIYVHAVDQINTITPGAGRLHLPKGIEKIHSAQQKAEIAKKIRERIHRFAVTKFSDLDEIPKFSINIEFGVPEKIIIDAAERTKASLIVMGNRKKSPLSRMFLGSTANKVLQSATIPVLLVPLPTGLQSRKKLATL
jgi:nucleotide-binding universal stress UspA family protein